MLNQVTIQGRMVKDCEVRATNNGNNMVTFTVAVPRNYKNSQGQYDSDFIDCVSFEKTSFIPKYFHKGDSIIVTGELQTRLYDGQDGKKHKAVVVSVSKALFCGDKNSNSNSNSTPVTTSEPVAESGPSEFEQSEPEALPFE